MNFIKSINKEFFYLMYNNLQDLNNEKINIKNYQSLILANVFTPRLNIKQHIIYRVNGNNFLCNNCTYSTITDIIYIIPMKDNNYIQFAGSSRSLIMSFIDHSRNFDYIYVDKNYHFSSCYLCNINAFNELLKDIYDYNNLLEDIYDYNNLRIGFKQFKQDINQLIDIINSNLLIYNL